MPYADRSEAGRRLARRLEHLKGEDVVVLGLPRGGVPVAYELADALGAPLDAIVVRKLGVPFQPELAMGAIGEGGVRVTNENVLQLAGVDPADVARVEETERAELERRIAWLRRGREGEPLTGRTAVVVDDGIATGSTIRAACQVARAHGAARTVMAVPVAPAGTGEAMTDVADEVVVLEEPRRFMAVGEWYEDFAPVSDTEVVELLERAATRPGPAGGVARHQVVGAGDTDPDPVDRPVQVAAGELRLPGQLTLPSEPAGLVIFAHGSGSSRHSPRNRFVAEVLRQAGLGTLLFDLLVEQEEQDRANVFDIELLAGRMRDAVGWARQQTDTAGLSVGLFGASTGAAAALSAAADPALDVTAVVSRGGRPDLAGDRLAAVRAPTLLIVGGRDETVLHLNQRAAELLSGPHEVAVVPGATHLFEEPGTLRAAAELARGWFSTHLRRGVTASQG